MPKIKFTSFTNPAYIADNGFFSQWCCGCGCRHIWHFKMYKGSKKNGGPYIEINLMSDEIGTQLRKSYEQQQKPKSGNQQLSETIKCNRKRVRRAITRRRKKSVAIRVYKPKSKNNSRVHS